MPPLLQKNLKWKYCTEKDTHYNMISLYLHQAAPHAYDDNVHM